MAQKRRSGPDAILLQGSGSDSDHGSGGGTSGDESPTPPKLSEHDVELSLRELDKIARQDDPEEKLGSANERSLELRRKMRGIFSVNCGKGFSADVWQNNRLRVMRTVGRCLKACKRVRDLGLEFLFAVESGHGLSFPEVEAPMQEIVYSTDLRELYFSGFKKLVEDVEENRPKFWTLVAVILRNTENLGVFEFTAQAESWMLMSDVAQIAEALTWRGVSNLKALNLSDGSVRPTGLGFDSDAFAQLVDRIKVAKHVNHLDLIFSDYVSSEQLELDWPAFFEALASNSNLRYLRLFMPEYEIDEKIEAMRLFMPEFGTDENVDAMQKAMAAWLQTANVKDLNVRGPFSWETLLKSLRENTSLERLTV